MRNRHPSPVPWCVKYLLPYNISKRLLCIWASHLPESPQKKPQDTCCSSTQYALQTSLIEVQFAHFRRTPSGPNQCMRTWGPAFPESHRLRFFGSLCRKYCQKARTCYPWILHLHVGQQSVICKQPILSISTSLCIYYLSMSYICTIRLHTKRSRKGIGNFFFSMTETFYPS